MSEATSKQNLSVEVTAGAQDELRRVVAAEENQGLAVRVVFQGFG